MPIHVKSGSGVVDYSNRAWAAGAPGDRMVPTLADATANVAVARAWVWECTTAGTSTAAPAWPAAVTQDVTTVTQNGVVWTARKPGYSSGTTGDWAFATPYIAYGLIARGAGETVDISQNRSETVSTTITATAGTLADPCLARCVVEGAIPATTLATTAVANSTTNNGFLFQGYIYFYGVTWNAGTANNTAALSFITSTNGPGQITLENCNLNLTSSGASSTINFGVATGHHQQVTLRNTNVRTTVSGQVLNLSSRVLWDGGAVTSAASPTVPLLRVTTRGGLLATGIDFSSLPAALALICHANTGSGRVTLRGARLPSGWTGEVSDTTPTAGSVIAELHGASHAGGEVLLRYRNIGGTVREESVVVRSGGWVHKGVGYSLRAVTDATAVYPLTPLVTPELRATWNTTVGTPITLEVEIVHDSVTPLTDADIWLRAHVLATAGTQRLTTINGVKGMMAAPTAHPTSTAVWTTTGLATPMRQKLTLQVTPQEVGYIQAAVVIGKTGPYTVYIDNQINKVG